MLKFVLYSYSKEDIKVVYHCDKDIKQTYVTVVQGAKVEIYTTSKIKNSNEIIHDITFALLFGHSELSSKNMLGYKKLR